MLMVEYTWDSCDKRRERRARWRRGTYDAYVLSVGNAFNKGSTEEQRLCGSKVTSSTSYSARTDLGDSFKTLRASYDCYE